MRTFIEYLTSGVPRKTTRFLPLLLVGVVAVAATAAALDVLECHNRVATASRVQLDLYRCAYVSDCIAAEVHNLLGARATVDSYQR
jgi:hypothetical protein